MQELRTRTMQEALNAGKRQEARLIEQRVEKDAANDRMVEKAKVLDTTSVTGFITRPAHPACAVRLKVNRKAAAAV